MPCRANAFPRPCSRAVDRGCWLPAAGAAGASETPAVFRARARSSDFSTQERWSTPRASRKRLSCAAEAVAKSGGGASAGFGFAASCGSGASRVAWASPNELSASSRPPPGATVAGRAPPAWSLPKRSGPATAERGPPELRPPNRSCPAAEDRGAVDAPPEPSPLNRSFEVAGPAGCRNEKPVDPGGAGVGAGAGAAVSPSRKSNADMLSRSRSAPRTRTLAWGSDSEWQVEETSSWSASRCAKLHCLKSRRGLHAVGSPRRAAGSRVTSARQPPMLP